MKFGSSLTLKFDGGYFCGEMKLPSFAALCKPKKAKAYIEIEPVFEEPGDPNCVPELDRVAKAGIEWLIANQAAAAKVVLGAAKKKYPDVDLRMIAFHEIENGKLPYLGFSFGSKADEEHGFGVMLHGKRVVKVGSADIAVMDDAAVSDKRKTKKPAPKKKKAAAKKKR